MSQDKYIAASRGLRGSVLLLATTVAAVLQSMPQALGVDNYRNLRKAVDGLQKADAEMAVLEDELAGKAVEIEAEVKPAIDGAAPVTESDDAKKPSGRQVKAEGEPAHSAQSAHNV